MKNTIPVGTQDQILDDLTNRIQSFLSELQLTFKDINQTQFNFKPEPQIWSAAECIEHINITEKLYVLAIKAMLKLKSGVPLSLNQSQKKYKSGFIGRFIIKAVDPENMGKAKAPGIFIPASSQLSLDIIQELVGYQQNWLEIIQDCRNLDCQKTKIRNPLSALIKLKLGDCLIINILHQERHLNQAKRALSNYR